MKNKVSIKQRLKYAFDNTLSAGTIAIIGWLAIISILIVIIAGLIYVAFGIDNYGGNGMNIYEALWQSLMRSIDPGTIASDEGWGFRILGLLITIGGIFILSTLIGVLTSGLEGKLDSLRKGRSKVIEKNHTLILGWSAKIIPILSELIIANENQKRPRIVILADVDKIEMEDELKTKIPKRKNSKIICRTGSPLDITDLEIVSFNEARSIIILSPEDDNPDTNVIKSVLAVTNNPNRKKEKFHIVAEIVNESNIEAAYLVGKDEAIYVQSNELTARLTAQSCRQSGLSVIYTELIDFDGDEIYFKNEPSLSGKKFQDALFAYNNSSVIGFMNIKGEVKLNPPPDTILESDDKIIAISEDDDTIILSERNDFEISKEVIRDKKNSTIIKETNLILGWNNKAYKIIRELDNYVAKESELVIMADKKEFKNSIEKELKRLKKNLKNQNISFFNGKTTKRTSLEKLDVTSFQNIILLSYPDPDIQKSDAKTLICLLHLRNISEQKGKVLSIVSEMNDIKNRDLAEVTRADDFIISDNLISLMMSQLSENKDLKKVFDDLFDADGSEIYLKPISDYIETENTVNFYTLLESARIKNQIAIGYRLQKDAHNISKSYGIILNPKKDEKVKFSREDKIIVLSEN